MEAVSRAGVKDNSELPHTEEEDVKEGPGMVTLKYRRRRASQADAGPVFKPRKTPSPQSKMLSTCLAIKGKNKTRNKSPTKHDGLHVLSNPRGRHAHF